MRIALLIVLAACASDPHSSRIDSTPAVTALQASQFDEARSRAGVILAQEQVNARAAAVHAIVAYRDAALDMRDEVRSFRGLHAFRHEPWQRFATALEAIDRDLAIAAKDPDFALELCLACWQYDWNGSGEVDERDRQLFELELDARTGSELAAGDPRRRPTYRFDAGDIEWARAMIAFQRAAAELVLAYDWSDVEHLFGKHRIVFRLLDARHVHRARELLLEGLAHSARERAAYLAETDDDREWVPNPRQHSFAMPLEVDAALYATWDAVLGDVRRMLRSEQGISLRELQQLLDPREKDLLPDAYLDLGAMFRAPKDIVLEDTGDLPALLRGAFGNGYTEKMPASPLLSRLAKMKTELARGEDTLDRKLRYLLWVN
jgi:hypothetical protein